jgi:undecaprenyl diphosphate synthase
LEISQAAKKIASAVKNGELSEDDITPETFSKYLYFDDFTAVDLIIRPSGEYRLSNFLLWQSAYSELYFTDTLWPDMTSKDVDAAVAEFYSRKRRFGGL